MMSKKIRPNKFKFDAFDAGLDDIPGRDGGSGPLVEIEPDDAPQDEPKPKTAQEYVQALVRGEL